MAQVTISFEADLRKATESFVAMARRVKDVDGGLAQLTRTAGKAATEIEKAGPAHERAGKGAKGHSDAVGGLIGHFSSIVGIGAAVYKAIDYIGSAHDEARERARQYADELRGLIKLNQELAGGSGYKLGATTQNRQMAAELGVAAKVDKATSLGATAKGLQEGAGRADILAALQFGRVTGVDPTKFLEVYGKAADSGQKIGGADLANVLLRLQGKVGSRPEETLDLLDKLVGGGAQLGYGPSQVAGLAAAVGQVLPGKKAASAIDTTLQALAGQVDVKRGGKMRRVPLTGTAQERLDQLARLDPQKYADLTGDAQTGVVVGQIRGGALQPLAPGDLLGPALRARDADTYSQATDAAAQADSAASLTEADQGATYTRMEAKRKLLYAALTQAGKGALYQKFAAGTIPELVAKFGGLPALEAEFDKAAAEAGVSLDPNKIVRGTAGQTVQIGANGAMISPAERDAIHSRAMEEGHRRAGHFRAFGVGPWVSGNAPEPGWHADTPTSPGGVEQNAKFIEDRELRIRQQQLEEEKARADERMMKENNEQLKEQTRLLRRGRNNGSLRDWRGEEAQLRVAAGFPRTDARAYFG